MNQQHIGFWRLIVAACLLCAGGCAAAAAGPATAPLSAEDFDLSPPFGNAGSIIEKKGENHFVLILGAQPKHPQWPNFIQFSIKCNARGNPLKLDITFTPQGKNDTKEENIGAGNYRFFGGGRQFWSYDKKAWKEINLIVPKGKDSDVCTLEFPTFTEDQVYVTTQNPLTQEDILALREELRNNPLVKIHVIGKSIQDREIIRFDISDFKSDVPPNKRRAHYAFNQHGVESNSRWRIMGMLRWALSDAAAEFRKHNVCHFIFTINP